MFMDMYRHATSHLQSVGKENSNRLEHLLFHTESTTHYHHEVEQLCLSLSLSLSLYFFFLNTKKG